MNRFEFGSLVASLREDMRWTQMELAEKSGVDVSAISNIERGARKTLLKDNMLDYEMEYLTKVVLSSPSHKNYYI